MSQITPLLIVVVLIIQVSSFVDFISRANYLLAISQIVEVVAFIFILIQLDDEKIAKEVVVK